MSALIRQPVRVLLLDDLATARFVVREDVRRADDVDVVGEADSGEAALDGIADLHPDVVLMDVFMAGMGGVEAARAISEKVPQVCIIGVSATEGGPVHDAMRDAGAVDFVPKTASVDQLVMAIQAAVTVRRCSTSSSQT